MRVSSLLFELGDSKGFTFEGNARAPFRGFDVRPTRTTGRGRFYLAIDENWPERTRTRRLGGAETTFEGQVNLALSSGAEGVILPSGVRSTRLDGLLGDAPTFYVENSYKFAQKIAKIIRSLANGRVIAVTGSAGKSTTQRMIRHALNTIESGRILAPSGNQNYVESVLGHISRLERSDYAVLEVGNSACFDLATASFNLEADISILTEISEAHLDARPPLEHVTSLRELALLKSTIFQTSTSAATAVINLDTSHSGLLCERAEGEGRRVIGYGESSHAQVRLEHYDPLSGEARVRTVEGELQLRIGAPGKHMVMNALATIASLQALSVPRWQEGISALQFFEPLAGRGQLVEARLGQRRFIICDESYNANPVSVRAALATFSSTHTRPTQRRLIILGDMVGVGDSSEQIHRSLVTSVVQANADQVMLFGSATADLHDELRKQGHGSLHWDTLDELVEGLEEVIGDGDILLAKASGSTGLNHWISTVRLR